MDQRSSKTKKYLTKAPSRHQIYCEGAVIRCLALPKLPHLRFVDMVNGLAPHGEHN